MKKHRNHDVLLRWLPQLSNHTGRPAAELEQEGLLFTDFPGEGLNLNFEDGSRVTFRYAFAVQSLRHPGIIAVFTEHNGYYEFPFGEGDILSIGMTARSDGAHSDSPAD